jgi:hypothetical protein
MLFIKKKIVYFENHMKHTNTFYGQNAEFSMLKHVVHAELLGLKELN